MSDTRVFLSLAIISRDGRCLKIENYSDGTLYLSLNDEGTEVDKDKLFECLFKFYDENF